MKTIIKLASCLYHVSTITCFTSSTSVNARTHQRGEVKLMVHNNTGDSKKRLKKHQIDDLVRGIGLEPVAKKTKSNNHQQQKKTTDTTTLYDLQSPNISLKTQLDYSRNGHAALRSFLPKELIIQLREELISYTTTNALLAWRQKVEVQLADSSDDYYKDNACSIANNLKSIEGCQDMLESLGIDTSNDLPFLQHFNTWRASTNSTPTVRKLCLSSYLAQSASILLNTPTVRLYQDSLFHKRVGDGPTPWHSDARMAPFDTSNMITFWIPLQKVSIAEEGGTGLLFVDTSHNDFALPYWNGVDGNEYDRLENRYGDDGGISHHMPLDMGDVTVHNGWTLHSADGADFIEEGQDRYAFSVTYVDVGQRSEKTSLETM